MAVSDQLYLLSGLFHLLTRSLDRQTTRRLPFANWMKRLASLKSHPDHHSSDAADHRRRHSLSHTKSKKHAKNNPYPLSGQTTPDAVKSTDYVSFSDPITRMASSEPSFSESGESSFVATSTSKRKSLTNNVPARPNTVVSDTVKSKSPTANTQTTQYTHHGGDGSLFSSPDPSLRSLTTTLTTMQSQNAYPGMQNSGALQQNQHNYPNNGFGVAQQIGSQFTHQYPTSPTSLSATMAPHQGSRSSSSQQNLQATTYFTATANNTLSDDASVLTLASSSRNPRRRNSLDTNASVLALPPSSAFGGSRESLPLSVLSGSTRSVIVPPTTSSIQAIAGSGPASHGGDASTSNLAIGSGSGSNSNLLWPTSSAVDNSRSSHDAADTLADSTTDAASNSLVAPEPHGVAMGTAVPADPADLGPAETHYSSLPPDKIAAS